MRNLFKLKNSESQRGAAMVEFAIIVPVLLLLLFGIIEFSLLLYNQQVITNAAREGARIAINPVPKASEEDIKKIVEDYISSARLITFKNNSPVTVVNNLDGDPGEDVTVSVEYIYEFLLPGIINLGATYPMQSITVMRLL